MVTAVQRIRIAARPHESVLSGRNVRDVLNESASEGNVEHLDASADRKDGYISTDSISGEFDLKVISRPRAGNRFCVPRSAVEARLYIGSPHQKNPLAPFHQFYTDLRIHSCWNEKRNDPAAIELREV
jgi:hypothetical protein